MFFARNRRLDVGAICASKTPTVLTCRPAGVEVIFSAISVSHLSLDELELESVGASSVRTRRASAHGRIASASIP